MRLFRRKVFVYGALLSLGLIVGNWGSNVVDSGLEAKAQFPARVFMSISLPAPDGKVAELERQLLGTRTIARGLDRPIGLVCGPDGSLYVAERNRRQIVRLDPATGGRSDTFPLRSSVPPFAAFRPYWLTFASTGEMFVTTVDPPGLWRLSLERREAVQLLTSAPFPDAFGLANPTFLTTGPFAEDLLVAVWTDVEGTEWVARIPHPDYTTVEEFIPPGDRGLHLIGGIALDPEGNLLVSDFTRRGRILRYSPEGSFRDLLDVEVQYPLQMAFDSQKVMYLTAAQLGERGKASLRIVYPGGGQQVIGGLTSVFGVAVCE